MHSASKRTTCVGAAVAPPKPRAMMLRWLVLPLVLLAMAPAECLRAIGRTRWSRSARRDRWHRRRHWWHRRQRRARQHHRGARIQRHTGRTQQFHHRAEAQHPSRRSDATVAAEYWFGHQHSQQHDQQRTCASGPGHQRTRQHRQSGRPRNPGGDQSTPPQRRAAGRGNALRRRRGHAASAIEPDRAGARCLGAPAWPDPSRIAARRADRHDLPSLAHRRRPRRCPTSSATWKPRPA